jgi:hypothetical protein
MELALVAGVYMRRCDDAWRKMQPPWSSTTSSFYS